MTDIRRDIERILNSSTLDGAELSYITEVLVQERLFDLADEFTTRLLQNHTDDTALLMRAWYLTDIAGRYREASDILRTIGSSDDVMFALLSASVKLHLTNDADDADSILEEFSECHDDKLSDMALEAARMFVSSQFTDLAEKWIMRYEGERNTDFLLVYGDILIAKEDFSRAADVYRQITISNERCFEAWIRLSDVLINIKDYNAAMEAATHALSIEGGSRKAQENIHVCTLCLNRQITKHTITNNH